jgi:hypothetical protein
MEEETCFFLGSLLLTIVLETSSSAFIAILPNDLLARNPDVSLLSDYEMSLELGNRVMALLCPLFDRSFPPAIIWPTRVKFNHASDSGFLSF